MEKVIAVVVEVGFVEWKAFGVEIEHFGDYVFIWEGEDEVEEIVHDGVVELFYESFFGDFADYK